MINYETDGYTRDNIDLKWDNVEPIQMSPTLEMPQFDLEKDVMTKDFTIDVSGSKYRFTG